ncbi:MAG: ABC transporter ATP-binding protein [Candidatus Omnitrophica bacterium]|nr:ABC transporter ATP-binding protein [Candidatus Omnitrophota bacterium]
MKVIELKDVWEKYRIKYIEEGKVFWEDFWTLKGINLGIEKGETLAIIGENGVGKTTLLKLIAGLITPDRGEIKVEGKVSALLEPGLGFHPELTGRENIYLSASLFGLKKENIDSLFEEICDFASLGKFIYSPLKYYSQGMFVRLSFSIAVHLFPDILLIDEILTVGDIGFQKKCISKLFELKNKGLTLILVTQDLALAKMLAKRGVFLRKGEIVEDGSIEKVISSYIESIKREEIVEKKEEKKEVISYNRLKLISEEGRIKIFWEGRELTCDNGLYTAIYIEDKWYHSFDFPIKVKKINEKTLQIITDYPPLSLKEYIKINILTEKEIFLEIEMELEEETLLSNFDIRLEVASFYQFWMTNEEEGCFSGKFVNEIIPVRLRNHRAKELGLKGKEGFPNFIFSINNIDNWLSSIYKRKENSEKIVLQFSKIIPRRNQKSLPGRYNFFSGRIILDKDLVKEQTVSLFYPLLKKEDLEFIFAEGRGKIFGENKEITTGLGMYTSFRVKGIWYDSSLALWEIRRKNSKEIEVLGNWFYIPVSQFWKISLLDNQKILWRVETEISEKADLELEQISLMFISEYKNWIAQDVYRGNFLEEFSEDYDILPFRFFYGRANELKSSGQNLPLLIFRDLNKDNSFRAVVGNSDNLYKARLFQFQKNLSGEKLKGYFLGEVELTK